MAKKQSGENAKLDHFDEEQHHTGMSPKKTSCVICMKTVGVEIA